MNLRVSIRFFNFSLIASIFLSACGEESSTMDPITRISGNGIKNVTPIVDQGDPIDPATASLFLELSSLDATTTADLYSTADASDSHFLVTCRENSGFDPDARCPNALTTGGFSFNAALGAICTATSPSPCTNYNTGQCLLVRDTANPLSVNSEAVSTGFSISVWLALPALPTGTGAIFSRYEAGTNQREFYFALRQKTTNGPFHLYFQKSLPFDGTSQATESYYSSRGFTTEDVGTTDAPKWVHVAMTFDPSTMKVSFYINGALDSENSIVNAGILGAAARTYVGCLHRSSYLPDNFFQGTMDDFAFFKGRVLTPREVLYLSLDTAR